MSLVEIWSYLVDFCYCQTLATLLMTTSLSNILVSRKKNLSSSLLLFFSVHGICTRCPF